MVRGVLGALEALPAERARRDRVGGRTGDEPEHRRDAERHVLALVRPEHQQFERVRARRDVAERLHPGAVGADEDFLERARILLEVADVPGHVPDRDDPGADDQRGERVAPFLAERLRGERERDQPAADDERRDEPQRARERGIAARQQARQVLAAGELDRDPVDGPDPHDAEQSAQRHVGGDPEHDEHHQRLQVAGAGAQQRLRAAARREHHAEAEHQAADDVRQPQELRPGVDRFRRVDQPGPRERLRAEHRDADRREPHPHPRPVAHVHDVRHRAHRAEVAAVHRDADDERDRERRPRDEVLQRGDVGFGHR